MRTPAPRIPVVAALTAAAAIAATAVLAFAVPAAARVDTQVANSFWLLQRKRLAGAEHILMQSADVKPFLILAAALVIFAGLRRRRLLVAGTAFILLAANLSTEILKSLMPPHTAVLPGSPVATAGAFPSGHATACMSLVLCAVMVAPGKLRPAVAAVGSMYVLVVADALLVLGIHYTTDVIGGFLMASFWSLLAVAVFRLLRVGARERATGCEGSAPSDATAPVAWVLGLALSGGAVAIMLAPPEIATVALGAAFCLIGIVGAGAVVLVARLAPEFTRRSAAAEAMG